MDAAVAAVSRVSPVDRAARVSPVSPIRPEIGLDDLRPDPALIPLGDITQFEALVYGSQGRVRTVALTASVAGEPSDKAFNTDLVADRIQLTLSHLRGRIDL